MGELTKVQGKTTLLFRIAEAADQTPDGTIREVIFPVAGEQTISELVKEYRSSGPAYVQRIYRKIRTSYAQHYRRMLPLILSSLTFCSGNASCQSLLDAIALLIRTSGSKHRHFSLVEAPVAGVIAPKWRDAVIEVGPKGEKRVNRISYEICMLQTLRKKLRTKEVWVKGAGRFCDPSKDLPQDFDERREHYLKDLKQPLAAKDFIKGLQSSMHDALYALNDGLPQSQEVRLISKNGNARISISPFKPLPDPPNLEAMRQELLRRWSGTSLLDVLKETDLRVGFTQDFTSLASRSSLEGNELSRRLLLALYGLGTNIGLKALADGRNNVSYKELLYVRRRYLHPDNLQLATRMVANATMQIRLPEIWGEGTTSCASDSTQFAAWDQNLMTEWHQRYGGRGVMIYWHVDTNATCIHSQLKLCSSSEVAAMIEGVLHHCTEMEIDRQYVDTHGQSVIAFAFCYLLGFDLMPRFKGIEKQKLSRPDLQSAGHYPNIAPLFVRKTIDWDLIEQQYDEMVRLAVALLKRTAEPEAILRRFSRGATAHPTYSALLELGRAAKTIFLCKYLNSEELRREINAGLNVVERWNGVNSFIYYGNGGEFVSNRLEDQEISALSLHLLQASMVHINTIMIQDVLQDSGWRSRMSDRDWAGLSPLPHRHFNPYGDFDLDMEARLPLQDLELAA